MPRVRELGIAIGEGKPGLNNAITDVSDIRVGYATLIEGNDVRTGVTVILPFEGQEALFAGTHRLNGNGEMTGVQWIHEAGMLTSPIGITNTHSVGAVHEGLIAHAVQHGPSSKPHPWSLPVVAETWDGRLNDINGFHVKREHVEQAIADAHDGSIAEGSVGGGTGMICHGFKGGTGTSSRRLDDSAGGYPVGVLVQANHGRRSRLRVNGVPVGEEIPASDIPLPSMGATGDGSIIVIVATDAPLIPTQCNRLAQRAGLGIGRTGGVGEDSSGDLFLAFTTGNRPIVRGGDPPPLTVSVSMLQNAHINVLFDAVVEATEEAIVNALLAAQTMSGYQGATAYGLAAERFREVMQRYGRGSAAPAG